MVGYTMACFGVACVLTIIVAMFRPIKQHDDWKAWKCILGFMFVIGAAPYLFVEIQTATKGKDMKPGVQSAIDEAELRGKLDFYRVTTVQGNKAHVIALAGDMNEFGLPERVIMEIDLVKGKHGWEADAYTIVNSFHRQRDSTTMPPYW